MRVRTLTFVVLEERKEAEEHERLEVIQGVYWVLKAWGGGTKVAKNRSLMFRIFKNLLLREVTMM